MNQFQNPIVFLVVTGSACQVEFDQVMANVNKTEEFEDGKLASYADGASAAMITASFLRSPPVAVAIAVALFGAPRGAFAAWAPWADPGLICI